MFATPAQGMSITITGGSAEENSQMCTVLGAALRTCGYSNVQVEPQHEYPTHARHDVDVVNAIRRINPDLFDTAILVSGESEEEMQMNMAAMGYGNQPFSFGVDWRT